jgi:hypothetical protein
VVVESDTVDDECLTRDDRSPALTTPYGMHPAPAIPKSAIPAATYSQVRNLVPRDSIQPDDSVCPRPAVAAGTCGLLIF